MIAYKAEMVNNGIRLEKYYPIRTESTWTDDWDLAIAWLTTVESEMEDFHVCYSLHDFTQALFTLLSEEAKLEIQKKSVK